MVFDSGVDQDTTLMGVTPESAVDEFTKIGVDGVGANCGQGIEGYIPICRRMRKVTGLPITDTTGGFRCIRADLLRRIGFERIRSDGYAFQIEMNYRFHKHGARVKEIPFFFLDRERGESKLTLRIALEALWIVWWMRLADWLGRL